MIVHFVRKHYAQPGVTVTESKFLHDSHAGIDREVDIVIEGNLDGEPMLISIEVNERGRPATIAWAQEQIRKHQFLPTNRLVLVSKSGFTKSAHAAVTAEGGRVAAVTPKIFEVDGRPAVKSLFADQLHFKPIACRMLVFLHDGSQLLAAVYFEEKIYDSDGIELGSVDELTQETLGIGWLRRDLSEEAHNHPERDGLKSFTRGIAVASLGYHLRSHDTGELCLIATVELLGDFSFTQQELAFTIADMADRRYGFTEAPILGLPAIWVATTHPDTQKTTISWRTKDDKPLIERRSPVQVSRFPGLATLEPQPDLSSVPPPYSGGRQEAMNAD
jgi:hypothetical protein